MRRFDQLVTLTKRTVAVAATCTGGCAGILVAAQAISWFRHDEWDSYTLSSLMPKRHAATYTVASSMKADTNLTDVNQLLDWVLGLPVMLPLLIALVGLIAFWLQLSKYESAERLRRINTPARPR